MKKIAQLSPILLFLLSCNDAPEQKQKNNLTYFDVKGYFEKEAGRLQKLNPIVQKTVEVNGSPETMNLKIRDWKNELAVFSEADINKDSWKGLFKLEKQQGKDSYLSADKKVPVKKVEVSYISNKISKLLIVVKNNNSLYTSTDSLVYYPDSVYKIIKSQDIKLWSKKKYKVVGVF